jgi:hypothetical protein
MALKKQLKPLHLDYCTHMNNPVDRDILTRPLFDVNMRLFQTSATYNEIVQQCCAYLVWCSTTEKEGYKKPHGFSGANAGIPFNIIAVGDEAMINPKIVSMKGRKIGLSNCGSLTLEQPIKIWRWEEVTIEYFDTKGSAKTKKGYYPTEQHEIDHNNGILITQRQVQAEEA